MKHTIFPFVLFLLFTIVAHADDIATLRTFLANPSDDAVVQHGVYMACLNLTRTGTAEAVPVLRQLLDDERFSTVARTALINIPGDEGVRALRESLQTLQGRNQIAVINTLGNVRDAESVPAIIKIVEAAENEELVNAGLRALGNIMSDEAHLGIVSQIGDNYDPGDNTVLIEVMLNVAEWMRQDGNIELAAHTYGWIFDVSESGIVRDAAVLGSFTMETERTEESLVNLLKGNLVGLRGPIEVPFKVLQRVVLESKFDQTGTIVLENLGNLPEWQQAALVRNLGARKEADIVPTLIEILTQSNESALQLAAIEALGEIGDLRAVDAILLAVEADDKELADAARESLKLFEGEEFDKKIISLLGLNNIDDKNLILAAIEVVNARQIVAASANLKALISGENAIRISREDEDSATYTSTNRVLPDGTESFGLSISYPDDVIARRQIVDNANFEIRLAAIKAFANSSEPTLENITFLLEQSARWESVPGVTWLGRALTQRNITRDTLREAILTLCRRTGDRDNAVNLFASAPVGSATFYLDCLFQLGSEKAAIAIFEYAMKTAGTDGWTEARVDALHNRATELLGQWTTPEVAPFLIEIAEKHPIDRYRSRTFRGYLRVIRQMGLPVEEKVAMAEKAVAVADAVGLSDADKEQAAEVLERFRAMVKGRPIFDGKTFDGWEVLGDADWFRIEEGAIVGGSLDGGNPNNGFISTKQEYGDFTLYIECKAIGPGANGGVQFRSLRAQSGNQMIGYQADLTSTTQYWGSIYDENRRNRTIAEPSRELIERLFRPGDWNEYMIVCKGNNIKVFLNGTLTVDYTETDADIPARGFIGMQIQGGANEVWYRSIRVEE